MFVIKIIKKLSVTTVLKATVFNDAIVQMNSTDDVFKNALPYKMFTF